MVFFFEFGEYFGDVFWVVRRRDIVFVLLGLVWCGDVNVIGYCGCFCELGDWLVFDGYYVIEL